MDIQPQSTQKPISDDQELAKVLAGVPMGDDATDDAQTAAALASDTATVTTAADEEPAKEPSQPDTALPTPTPMNNDEPDNSAVPMAPITPAVPNSNSGDLEGIKKDALNELRPLVDKLSLEPEEKFDTYLLLLRSTDDKELIAPAYAAAQAITDESRKAQALLDIIKEIDFLSTPK